MRRILLALLFVTAASLAACADDGDDDNGAGTTVVDGTTTSTSTAAGGTTVPGGGGGGGTPTTFAGSTSPVSTPPTEHRYLVAVRVARQSGFDRVVFEFEAGVPGHAVRFTDRPITEDGSGDPVTVEGDAILEVRMEAASGADLSNGFRQTYKGPTRVEGGDAEVVTEVVRTGDFEAVLTWVIGLRERNPFRVSTVTDNRLVIDIAHDG